MIRNGQFFALFADQRLTVLLQIQWHQDHVCPAALVIAEGFKFHQHNQQDGEQVIYYICAL